MIMISYIIVLHDLIFPESCGFISIALKESVAEALKECGLLRINFVLKALSRQDLGSACRFIYYGDQEKSHITYSNPLNVLQELSETEISKIMEFHHKSRESKFLYCGCIIYLFYNFCLFYNFLVTNIAQSVKYVSYFHAINMEFFQFVEKNHI